MPGMKHMYLLKLHRRSASAGTIIQDAIGNHSSHGSASRYTMSGDNQHNRGSSVARATTAVYNWQSFEFAPARESQVARAMSSRYFKDLDEYAESDVVIVGAGPSGLSCAYVLAKSRPDLKIAIIESNVAPGGSCFLGGQLFSAMILRKPADEFVRDLGIEYEDEGNFIVIKHAALFITALCSKILALPNVKLFNATRAEDLITRTSPSGQVRIVGVVTNWTPMSNGNGESHFDPSTISADVVVTCTGKDMGSSGAFCVKKLVAQGMLKGNASLGLMDMNRAEDAIVRGTREIYPGLVCAGMELAECDSLNSVGASFGAMVLSGVHAAEEAIRVYNQ